jgi:DNA-binding CsgD family transcriptional regulator
VGAISATGVQHPRGNFLAGVVTPGAVAAITHRVRRVEHEQISRSRGRKGERCSAAVFIEGVEPVPNPPLNVETNLAPHLAVEDVAAMLRLVSETCDPAVDLTVAKRRQLLFAGVAKLVDADGYLGAIGCSHADDACNAAPMHVFDGGWRDDVERMRMWGIAQNLELARPVNQVAVQSLETLRTVTFTREHVFNDAEFHASAAGQALTELGFDQFMLSVFPINHQFHSAIGLYRRLGRPAFNERDRTVVHILWQQVDWLHRQEIDLPVGTKFVELSMRERQVLILLLGGGTRRSAAEALELSEHTVGDHMKGIYRKLDVRTRGELLAKFIANTSA